MSEDIRNIWAESTLEYFGQLNNSLGHGGREELQTVLEDLLFTMQGWCHVNDVDFDELVRSASESFQEELKANMDVRSGSDGPGKYGVTWYSQKLGALSQTAYMWERVGDAVDAARLGPYNQEHQVSEMQDTPADLPRDQFFWHVETREDTVAEGKLPAYLFVESDSARRFLEKEIQALESSDEELESDQALQIAANFQDACDRAMEKEKQVIEEVQRRDLVTDILNSPNVPKARESFEKAVQSTICAGKVVKESDAKSKDRELFDKTIEEFEAAITKLEHVEKKLNAVVNPMVKRAMEAEDVRALEELSLALPDSYSGIWRVNRAVIELEGGTL